MGLPGRHAAPGELAEPVADLERAAQTLGGAAVLAADVDRQAVPLKDGDDLRVATDPACRGCREWRSVFELAQTIACLTGEHADIDVNYNLVRLAGHDQTAGRAADHVLGHRHQRVSAARRPTVFSRVRNFVA